MIHSIPANKRVFVTSDFADSPEYSVTYLKFTSTTDLDGVTVAANAKDGNVLDSIVSEQTSSSSFRLRQWDPERGEVVRKAASGRLEFCDDVDSVLSGVDVLDEKQAVELVSCIIRMSRVCGWEIENAVRGLLEETK